MKRLFDDARVSAKRSLVAATYKKTQKCNNGGEIPKKPLAALPKWKA